MILKLACRVNEKTRTARIKILLYGLCFYSMKVFKFSEHSTKQQNINVKYTFTNNKFGNTSTKNDDTFKLYIQI